MGQNTAVRKGKIQGMGNSSGLLEDMKTTRLIITIKKVLELHDHGLDPGPTT